MTIAYKCKESTVSMIGKGALATALMISMAGCVTVEAPEKPIVINLNINIKQEVVYRLDGDAKALIDEQGDIF